MTCRCRWCIALRFQVPLGWGLQASIKLPRVSNNLKAPNPINNLPKTHQKSNFKPYFEGGLYYKQKLTYIRNKEKKPHEKHHQKPKLNRFLATVPLSLSTPLLYIDPEIAGQGSPSVFGSSGEKWCVFG